MVDNKLCKVSGCRFSDSHVTKGHLCGGCYKYGHGLCECKNDVKKKNLIKFYNDIISDDKQCTFGGCKYKKLHTTEAHQCYMCKGRTHSKNTCPLTYNKLIDIKCPICKQINFINKNQQKIYGVSDTCVVCLTNTVNVFFPNCGHVCICSDCIKIVTNKDKNNIGEEYLIEMKYNINEIKIKLKEYPSYLNIYHGLGNYICIKRFNKDSELECLFISPDDIYDSTKIKLNDDFIDGYAYVITNMIHDN